jgi:hypothetical protein
VSGTVGHFAHMAGFGADENLGEFRDQRPSHCAAANDDG